MFRSHRSAIEVWAKTKIKADHALVPWLVRHSAYVVTRTRIGSDGRTAYQRMKGRRSIEKLAPFAETRLFKIPKTLRKVGDMEDRWELGTWLGSMMRSGEDLVGSDKRGL